jgi:predicted ATPase
MAAVNPMSIVPCGCWRILRVAASSPRWHVKAALTLRLWAGPEAFSAAVKRGDRPVEGTLRTESVALRLGFQSDDFSYAIDLGLPIPSNSAFSRDPVIKTECIWHGSQLRPSCMLVERRGPVVRVRQEHGEWDIVSSKLQPFESMFESIADPQRAAEVLFYDQFRTDGDAPARQVQIGTHTPVLAHDGRDLAAAIQTILEIGDAPALAHTISDAFPGSEIDMGASDGRLSVGLRQHGLLRPLSAAELSDGTLRYLLWAAALLTPRPPALMILNEPEASLHPDLLPALARLIGVVASSTQIWVVSHATRLIAALKQHANCALVQLEKELGETVIVGQGKFDRPGWKWPTR